MIKRLATSLFASVLTLGVASAAMAAEPDPGHPRVNEVTKRVDRQDARINAGVADGKLTPREAAHDRRADARIDAQMARDERKHDGHITKAEDAHLNKELNANSARIHEQRQ